MNYLNTMKSTLLRALFSSHIVLTRTLCLFAGCGFLACANLASADQFGNTEFPQVHQPEDALSALLKGAMVFQSPGVDLTLGLNNNEPTIAVDPNNPLHIAVATYLSLRVSVDGGNSFLPAVGAGVPPTHRFNRGGDSSLAFDSRGRLFWTYLLVTNGASASAFDIFIAQCNPTTGALLPGYPVNVTASTGVNLPAPANCHDKEWLAIDCHAGSRFVTASILHGRSSCRAARA